MPQLALPVALTLANALPGAAISVAAVEGVLTVGATIGASVGVSIASSALQRSLKPDTPGQLGAQGLRAINAPEVKASVKQSTPYQRIMRGRQRTGGAFAFYKAPGNGTLVVQHMYSRRKCSNILALNINGNRITFSSTPFGSILAPIEVDGQPDYPNRLRCCFQSGTLDQPTNPLLADIFPNIASTPGWRLPGIANAVYEFDYGADFDEFQALWGNVQIPDVQPEAEWAPVYDPRIGSHRLPTDPDDLDEWFDCQETWDYTENAALHAADHLWQKDGLNAGPTGVDWDKVAEAAERADEPVATRDTAATGKFEKRYTVGGVVTLDQQVADVFDGLLTASRATLIQGNDGKTWISHDAPKTPVFTITDDMLLGGVTYRGFKGRHDLANKTVTRFVAPGRQYQQSDAPPYIRADLIAEDGGELPLTVDLPFTPSPSTAQRIAKADFEDARIETSWSGAIDLRGLGVREDDCIEIASVICPHWNGLYLVDKWGLTLNLKGKSGVALQLVGYDAANSNDWNAANDDQAFDLADTETLLTA